MFTYNQTTQFRSKISRVVIAALILLIGALPVLAQELLEVASTSANEFSVDLYRAVREKSPNIIISPYSAHTVLALISGGARGQTGEEMATVLHLDADDPGVLDDLVELQRFLEKVGREGAAELAIANGFWPQRGARIKPDFLGLAEAFGTELRAVNYSEAEVTKAEIDAWAAKKTKGRIKEIITWELHPQTHLLLTNAVYFKGTWITQFDPERTEDEPFTNLDGSSGTASMMHQEDVHNFYEDEQLQAVYLPYVGNDLSMLVLLPRATDGIKDLESDLSVSRIDAILDEMWGELVAISLPSFELLSTFNLRDTVRSMGMTAATDPDIADFGGVAEPRNWLWLARLVQRAYVNVNEEGTEAAAVTVGGCFTADTPVQTPSGTIRIEEICPGTMVRSFDFENDSWTATPVVERRAYQFSGDLLTIVTKSGSVQATWNHPFLVTRGENLATRPVPADIGEDPVQNTAGRWVEADDLRPGDVLTGRSGDHEILAVTSRPLRDEVYVLLLDGPHNHLVGPGYLVHNAAGKEEGVAAPTPFTADHPFLFMIRENTSGTILFMGRVGEL